jgi:hypothetical protein
MPVKKIRDLKIEFLGFLSFVKIRIAASKPSTKIYSCLIDLLNISLKLLITESSVQLKNGIENY